MNRNIKKEKNVKQLSPQQEIDWLELLRKVWSSRKLILIVCSIGIIIGIIISCGIPKEYTASILIVPESSRRSSFSGISASADMAGIDMNSSSATERDAIYSVLYPDIIRSTPFLAGLFDVKVREQQDTIAIPLSLYLKERQKRPWWSSITSIPSKITGWGISLFTEKPKVEKAKSQIDIFRLTRAEAGMIGAISSRIGIEINKMSIRRIVTISVTMQDPLVAATVADTVLERLKEYVTEYRTSKARRMLDYTKKLRAEAQVEYHEAQENFTRYADVNQALVGQTSRAELARLRNEMNLALTTYNQTELQVRAAEARVKKVTPVLAVIQPAMVPFAPSKPRKMVIFVGCIFLAGAGSIGWILFAKDFVKGFLRDIRRKERRRKTNIIKW